MARLISDILEAREPHFSQQIADLEKIAGKPGIDVRLVSDLIQMQKTVLQSLGLDSSDTKTPELYYALIEKALSDSEALAAKLQIDPNDSPEIVVKKSIEFVHSASGNNGIWTLKPSVARKQLRENPPKKLMKIFSLRSIDSALKREALSLLINFAKKTEPLVWQDKYISQASKLNVTDFDYQNMEISQVSSLRQSQLSKAGLSLNQIVYLNNEVAGIIIITPKKRFEGDVLFLVHSILQNIKLLKSASLYAKLHSMESNFPKTVEAIRKQGFASIGKNYKIFGWNAYIKYLSSPEGQDDLALELILEDDFKAVDISQIIDNGSIWQHQFLVSLSENFMISCNLSDVILNAVNKYEPQDAHYYFGQRELESELFGRYIMVPKVRQRIDEGLNYG